MACYTFHLLHNGRAEHFERLALASAHDARAMAQAFAGEMLKHGEPSVSDSNLKVRVTSRGRPDAVRDPCRWP
ncbi:DUF6894 family protein [Sphingomonas turrisvirgatae]|uniref:DUF6894 family protein n=1 Tax=Sphingomonas turrisvirgatae TaxID=1888892 RepID=UPI003B97F9EB